MKFILGLGFLIGLAVWQGWVLQVLWGWFIAPTFAVPTLTIPQALGIALTVRVLTYATQYQQQDDRTWATSLVLGYIWPAFALVLGWVYTWFL